MAIWGDDSSTLSQMDYLQQLVPQFAIIHEGNVIMIDESPQFSGYITNGVFYFNATLFSIDSNYNFVGLIMDSNVIIIHFYIQI